MDLLGDLGTADQLLSVRSENAILQEKVKHLSFRVRELTMENESLKAEVELFRKEGALPNFSHLALGGGGSSMDVDDSNVVACDDFVRSGNGHYPQVADVVLSHLHGIANPLCCALNANDTILATGGADGVLVLCAWGSAGDETQAAAVVASASRFSCPGPVIAVAFHPSRPIVAAGCMDGTVWMVQFALTGGAMALLASAGIPRKHGKHVKTVAWCPTSHLLATASADGTVQLHQIDATVDYSSDPETTTLHVKTVETLHLPGAVESMLFLPDAELCCYARGLPYLSCFDTAKDYAQRKLNLNHGGRPAAAGTTLEDQHVSFSVMDMALSPNDNGKYLACATDVSRQIVLQVANGLHVRNLYGHENDGYSNPKIAWSSNGQYLLGNTQQDGAVCVWDVASTQIVQRMVQHGQTVRDMFASTTGDILVTTSFDKETKLWFAS